MTDTNLNDTASDSRCPLSHELRVEAGFALIRGEIAGSFRLDNMAKYSEQMEAELTALQSTGWQTIDSASRDGSWIAAKRMGKRPFCVRYIYGSWQDENNLLRDPTHFYALPTQPKDD